MWILGLVNHKRSMGWFAGCVGKQIAIGILVTMEKIFSPVRSTQVRSHTVWFELILIRKYTKAIKIYISMSLFRIFLDIAVIEKITVHVLYAAVPECNLMGHLFYILSSCFCFFVVIWCIIYVTSLLESFGMFLPPHIVLIMTFKLLSIFILENKLKMCVKDFWYTGFYSVMSRLFGLWGLNIILVYLPMQQHWSCMPLNYDAS
jgi:hypothetical protein